MGRENLAVGVDIGGTHITAALVNTGDKRIASPLVRASVNAGGTADEVIRTWAGCVQAAIGEKEVKNICLAMPGPFDYKAGISLMRGQNKYENLYGLPVKDMLAVELGILPTRIFIDNDAGCYLQGEIFDGAAVPFSDAKVIGITLGTGLGSATYHNGRSRSADKWCWPFKDGIAEDYLCTRWFVQRWHEDTGEVVSGVRALAERANDDTKAKELFDTFGQNLADFLLDFIAVEDPVAAVIGGNIAKAWPWFSPAMHKAIHTRHPEFQIKRASLGEQAPLLGAVSGWLRQEQSMLSS